VEIGALKQSHGGTLLADRKSPASSADARAADVASGGSDSPHAGAREEASARALPSDRLWTISEAAAFFGMGTGWVREHVPAVLLPGQGERRAVRYLPDTCRALARQFESCVEVIAAR
jgi:hypothetical protein